MMAYLCSLLLIAILTVAIGATPLYCSDIQDDKVSKFQKIKFYTRSHSKGNLHSGHLCHIYTLFYKFNKKFKRKMVQTVTVKVGLEFYIWTNTRIIMSGV